MTRARGIVATWGPWVALAVVAVYLWHGRAALLAARGAAEAATMRADGLAVEVKESRAEVSAQAAKLMALYPSLALEVAKIKASQPDARVVEAMERATEALEAHGATAPASPIPPGAKPRDVLVYRGDKLRIAVADLTLRAPGGTDAVAGHARVLRLDPTGEEIEIAAGDFAASLTRAVEVKSDPPPGWAFGAAGSCSALGCAVGPHVAFPPVRVPWVGGRLEFALGAPLLGSGPSVAATVDYRR